MDNLEVVAAHRDTISMANCDQITSKGSTSY